MRRESIEKEIKQAVVSAVINTIARIIIITISVWWLKSSQINSLFLSILWLVPISLALQVIFLPYMTKRRIKEIKEGELYESSKY